MDLKVAWAAYRRPFTNAYSRHNAATYHLYSSGLSERLTNGERARDSPNRFLGALFVPNK